MARWVVGAREVGPDDRVIALDLAEMRRAAAAGAFAVPVHAVGEPEPEAEVFVEIPRWRGHSFIPFLEWLVCAKLAAPGATVTWTAEKRGGATGLRRVLAGRGWDVEEKKRKGLVEFIGTVPAPGLPPQPANFTTELGGNSLTFDSDWGVFSEGTIDDGTKLLFDAVLDGPSHDTVLDVGTGSGPLAIGLVSAKRASRAVGTEIDSIALLLATDNAHRADVEIELHLTDDPAAFTAQLVVCNIPTHARTEDANVLLNGLAHHVRLGAEVLIVVHSSLDERYIRRATELGVSARPEAQQTHTVLRLTSS
jgi:16S rRNA G1207 methylase RsmC